MELRASPQIQAKLVDLADFDLAIQRGQRSIANLPNALDISGLKTSLEESKSAKHEAQIQLEAAQTEMKRADADAELVSARINKDLERLTSTSSAKDAQGLEHEIESLRKRQSELEEAQLQMLEQLEAVEGWYLDAESNLNSASGGLEQAQQDLAAQIAHFESEIAELQTNRKSLVDNLPPELVTLYERQQERYGVGVSRLTGGVSSASGVTLTESDLNHIRLADPETVILCPDSNAILIRDSETGI